VGGLYVGGGGEVTGVAKVPPAAEGDSSATPGACTRGTTSQLLPFCWQYRMAYESAY
jgi:hypothetical protein